MFKGTVGPQSGRTLRSIAEDKGTAGTGFSDQPAYDPMLGHPITKDFPKSTYKDVATESNMKSPDAAVPFGISAPFSIKGT
jgi:hypothetical protein